MRVRCLKSGVLGWGLVFRVYGLWFMVEGEG